MALKASRPRLGAVAPRIAPPRRDEHGHSRQAEPWRAWYTTPEWQELRLEVFARDGQCCQHPKHEGVRFFAVIRGRLVCDHVRPHRGDRKLFFDRTNLQTLCKTCHDTHKQAEERRDRARGLY